MSQHSHPFWGFPQAAWTRRKAAADGNEAGSVKTAWVGVKGLRDGPGTKTGLVAWLGVNGVRWGAEPGSGPGTKLQQTEARQDRLGWREGAKARGRAPKQDTNWCADSLAWRKGVR